MSTLLIVSFVFAPLLIACSSKKPIPQDNDVVPSNTFFVDQSSGSDENPGTRSAPWKTIKKATEKVTSGAVVTVLAGNYAERAFLNHSGSPDAPIVFQAEGIVVMQGFSVNANYVTISGFEITNTPDDDEDGMGIFVTGSHCLIENNYVHDATRGGIFLQASMKNYAGTSNCIVRNNRLYKNSQLGIEVQGENHRVEGNEVWGTIQYHPKWANPPSWVDADGIRFFGSGHIIRKNYIHDILFGIPENIDPHIDCFQTWSDEYHLPSSNTIIEQNRCDNAQAQSEEALGKGVMISNSTGGLIIRNNLINAFVNVYVGKSDDVKVINNTLTSDTTLNPNFYPSGITADNSTNVVVENNIFYNQAGHIIYIKDSVLFSVNNLVYRNDGQPIYTTDTYDPSADLMNMDPMFVDPLGGDFHLRQGSPAIDTGVALTDLTSDYDGISRPQGKAFDIGAYEWLPPTQGQ